MDGGLKFKMDRVT